MRFSKMYLKKFFRVCLTVGVPTIKNTDLSILCKWENVQNWQCMKHIFSPLYIVCVYFLH